MTVTSQEAVAAFRLVWERVHGPAYAALVPQEMDEALFKARDLVYQKRPSIKRDLVRDLDEALFKATLRQLTKSAYRRPLLPL
jgi:hypothetical protein